MERVEDLTEEIARKDIVEEDASKERNKLRMVLFDIQKEAERILAEARWHSELAASAQNVINNKAVKDAMVKKVAVRG